MGVLFLGVCFLFGLLVFVAWSSGRWGDFWSSRESLPTCGVGHSDEEGNGDQK